MREARWPAVSSQVAQALVERRVSLAHLVLRGAGGFGHHLGMARNGLGERSDWLRRLSASCVMALTLGTHLVDEDFRIRPHDLGRLEGGGRRWSRCRASGASKR